MTTYQSIQRYLEGNINRFLYNTAIWIVLGHLFIILGKWVTINRQDCPRFYSMEGSYHKQNRTFRSFFQDYFPVTLQYCEIDVKLVDK